MDINRTTVGYSSVGVDYVHLLWGTHHSSFLEKVSILFFKFDTETATVNLLQISTLTITLFSKPAHQIRLQSLTEALSDTTDHLTDLTDHQKQLQSLTSLTEAPGVRVLSSSLGWEAADQSDASPSTGNVGWVETWEKSKLSPRWFRSAPASPRMPLRDAWLGWRNCEFSKDGSSSVGVMDRGGNNDSFV